MEAKWNYRFDRDDHLSGFTCIAVDLEDLNGGAAVGYVSKKGTAFAATEKFLNILGYTVNTTRLSELNDTVDTSSFYVNPSDRGKVIAAQGRWVTIPRVRCSRYSRVDGRRNIWIWLLASSTATSNHNV